MIIDANMYWIPEELFTNDRLMKDFLSEVPEKWNWYGRCEEVAGTGKKQVVLEKPLGSPNLNYLQGDYTVKKQLADMDAAGVDKALLKVPGCHEWMSLKMCKLFNNGMYAHGKKSGGRLIPLAVVPPYGDPEMMNELERCRNELGMNSIQVSAHYGNSYLDDDRFSRFFEKVNELEMAVYVHHTPVPVNYQPFTAYNNVRRSYGRIVDQGLAVSRELYGGFFTKYPNIKMIHSMMGGAFFAIAGMMMPHGPRGKEEVSRFKSSEGDIEEQFRNNIFFETSHVQPWGRELLECAVKIVGADHIIFGTSYPVRREWLLEGPAFVEKLNISEEDKKKIMGENAARIYRC